MAKVKRRSSTREDSHLCSILVYKSTVKHFFFIIIMAISSSVQVNMWGFVSFTTIS